MKVDIDLVLDGTEISLTTYLEQNKKVLDALSTEMRTNDEALYRELLVYYNRYSVLRTHLQYVRRMFLMSTRTPLALGRMKSADFDFLLQKLETRYNDFDRVGAELLSRMRNCEVEDNIEYDTELVIIKNNVGE